MFYLKEKKKEKLAGKQWMNACSTYVVESANIK
jgi:hypothetical protein